MPPTPTTLTFRGLDHSDAIESDVHERVAWLEQFYPNITSCRVVIEIPHRHQRNGRPFHVRIDLSVPGRPPIVVSRDPSLHGSSKDIEEAAHHKADTILGAARHATVVVHEAFDAARRQLQDLARERRSDVKAHGLPAQ